MEIGHLGILGQPALELVVLEEFATDTGCVQIQILEMEEYSVLEVQELETVWDAMPT